MSNPLCKNCGGGLPQHQEGPCWCSTCMKGPSPERCRDYAPRTTEAMAKNEGGFGKKPPKPPKKAPKSMKAEAAQEVSDFLIPEPPVRGTHQREVFDTVRAAGDKGCTDVEVALKTGRDQTAVTIARNELVAGGLIWDSGMRRRDTKGQENVAWTALFVDAPAKYDSPKLVRDDVYVSHDGRVTTLHAGETRIRLSPTPGDLVEVTTQPRGADPDQENGPEVTILLVLEGNEEMYGDARNPFITPGEIMEMMADVITPGLNALTAVRKDL